MISKPRLALVVTLAISAFLNLYRLDQIGIHGIGNPYYAAAAQSMRCIGWCAAREVRDQ